MNSNKQMIILRANLQTSYALWGFWVKIKQFESKLFYELITDLVMYFSQPFLPEKINSFKIK